MSRDIQPPFVYLFNMSEDVWSFIAAITDPVKKQYEIDENAYLSDRELFSLAGKKNVIFLSPTSVSDSFQRYVERIAGKHVPLILTPKTHTGELSLDILADRRIVRVLKSYAKESGKLICTSYSTSLQFLNFVDTLRREGLEIETPEAPNEEDGWTVNFFGSKAGIRQLSLQSSGKEPDFRMPHGVICVGVGDAAKIAAKFYHLYGGVVLKTTKGHSGAGVLIFRPDELPHDYRQCEQALIQKLSGESYWQTFPIVVEEYISVNSNIGGGSPSVEFRISKSGKVEFLYYCGMNVSPEGVFRGVEISQEAIPTQTAIKMVDIGFFIAQEYAKAGYRGYFDVDFVVGKNGSPWVTESNVRRTGGTYVYELARFLCGKDFFYHWVVFSNNIEYPSDITASFDEIIKTIEPILFDRKRMEGVIITSENLLKQGRLNYIVIAKTRKHAAEIESKLMELISQKTG